MNRPLTYEESGSGRFRQKKLIAKKLGDELLLYDEQTNNAHCLNEIASEIWKSCEREGSATEIAELLRANLPAIEEGLVEASLSQMTQAGILEETTAGEGISLCRRALIGKLGITAAAMFPISITTVFVPPAAAVTSCRKLAQTCSDTSPCCPGLNCHLGLCIIG